MNVFLTFWKLACYWDMNSSNKKDIFQSGNGNYINSQHMLSEWVSEVAQSCPTLCDPMDYQAPPSMGFSRQECWSGLPFPSPGDLPNPGIEPWVSCIAGEFFTIWVTPRFLINEMVQRCNTCLPTGGCLCILTYPVSLSQVSSGREKTIED